MVRSAEVPNFLLRYATRKASNSSVVKDLLLVDASLGDFDESGKLVVVSLVFLEEDSTVETVNEVSQLLPVEPVRVVISVNTW